MPGGLVSVDVIGETSQSKFLHPINTLIGWAVLEKMLDKVGKRSFEGYSRPAYHPLVLCKMMLLPTWYRLADMGLEDMVHDTLRVPFVVYA